MTPEPLTKEKIIKSKVTLGNKKPIELCIKTDVKSAVEWLLKEIEKLRTKLKIVRKEGNYKQFVIADELLKELDWFENLIKKAFEGVLRE